MQVVLLKDFKALGKKGEVKEVKDGYAVNFLLPQNIADCATPETIKMARTVAEKSQKEKEKAKNSVQKIAQKVNGKKFRIAAKISSGGRLYASLPQSQIEDMLLKSWKATNSGISVKLDLPQPIHEVGKYPVDIELIGGKTSQKAEIILEVVGE